MASKRAGRILQISIFATGCAGIVAEFVLSTLATYLVGNAVFQWTMVMSLMLFAMGLGSRLSKSFDNHLLDLFVWVECALSVLCSLAAVSAFGLAAWVSQINLVIYSLAVLIGLLIGLEIPLVTRLNDQYEELRFNIANVMEKDYFGSLLGGFFFAFFALPWLGLTYTPIILGSINLAIAALFVLSFGRLLRYQWLGRLLVIGCFALIGATALLAQPIITFGEQRQFKDKIIYSEQTPYQKIIFTRWRSDIWLYLNGQEQFSSYDEERYHEPLVHPAMQLAPSRQRILVLGGGDGLALREIWKYDDVEQVTLVDLDPAMVRLARDYEPLVALNKGAMVDERLQVVHQDAARFLQEDETLFNVIIIDLPDPDSVDLMHLYSLQFYRLVERHLAAGGVVVSQATSPWFSNRAFLCINKTMAAAGFSTAPFHNQIPTMGEWGWVLAVRARELPEAGLRRQLGALKMESVDSRFLNNQALQAMFLFGKGMLDQQQEVAVNSEVNPVLYRYYSRGSWDVY